MKVFGSCEAGTTSIFLDRAETTRLRDIMARYDHQNLDLLVAWCLNLAPAGSVSMRQALYRYWLLPYCWLVSPTWEVELIAVQIYTS